MRYAIISDIHGNLEALKAVFNDIKKQNIDRIVCLGDIVSKGSHGHECVELIKANCDAVVKGNNDAKYSQSLDEIAFIQNIDYDYFYWTQKQLTSEDIQFLRKLPMCCEFYLSGRLVRCFHATPTDYNCPVFNFENYDEKIKLFQPYQNTTASWADVVVYGHTHHISYEKLFGRTLVNAGSVGNAINAISNSKFNTEKTSDFIMAEYVILSGNDGETIGEVGIELRHIPYNKEKELKDYNYASKKQFYEKEIICGEYRHPERIFEKLNK